MTSFELSPSNYWTPLATLDDVRLYLLFCNASGHKDWRRPTSKELHSICFTTVGYPVGPKWMQDHIEIESGILIVPGQNLCQEISMPNQDKSQRILIPVRTNHGL